MQYYYPEHLEGYERVKANGKIAWDEIHGQEEGFSNFSSRGFLERILPQLTFSTCVPTALEYGCGTGPGACFLSEQGFQVDAIDLIPLAIEIAKEIASRRRLRIHFEVADICHLPQQRKQYDLIVDSYCLQCIVFDEERQRVLSTVQSRLKSDGYYLISTAILDEEHEKMIGEDRIEDPSSGIIYNRYGSGLIDIDTGIALRLLDEDGHVYPDAVRIANRWYLPYRRHLRPTALKAELSEAGFTIVFDDQQHAGNVACILKTV